MIKYCACLLLLSCVVIGAVAAEFAHNESGNASCVVVKLSVGAILGLE
jgi:hypothetical protein